MSKKADNIEVHLGPKKLGVPDNLEEVMIDFINRAKKTLDIAVQELDSIPIARTIIKAKQSGVTVRIVLEGDYILLSKIAFPIRGLLVVKMR